MLITDEDIFMMFIYLFAMTNLTLLTKCGFGFRYVMYLCFIVYVMFRLSMMINWLLYCASGAPNSAKFRGGCRFDKGGVTNFFKFLRDKNINFLEFLR